MSHGDIGRYSKRMIQLLWDPEPLNDDPFRAPIWCLGQKYECDTVQTRISPVKQVKSTPDLRSRSPLRSHGSSPAGKTVDVEDEVITKDTHNGGEESPEKEAWPEAFLDDFESRIRFTYRSSFPPIPKATDPTASAGMTLSVRLKSQLVHQNGFTSDSGWGCMIRSGQCLLANALAMARKPRDQKLTKATFQDKEVLNWFIDDPKAPFSIHKFVELGESAFETFPGQWFGPSATAKCIEVLANNFATANLRVYVTGDGPDVFEDKLYEIACSGTEEFTPTLLLVGTRLGIERVTPVYWDALKESLQMVQSIGIAGGRPSSSHYFIGVQGSNFFYLDPHQTQLAVPFRGDPGALTQDEIASYHTRRLRRMSIEELDPSMLIAFLFRERSDWLDWRRRVQDASCKAIFHVADSTPTNYGYDDLESSLGLDIDELEDENEAETVNHAT